MSIDISDKIGRLYGGSPAEWPMYSYDRPSSILWNAIAGGLHERGWTETEIKEWLQSRDARHALDGELGDMLEALGREWARRAELVTGQD